MEFETRKRDLESEVSQSPFAVANDYCDRVGHPEGDRALPSLETLAVGMSRSAPFRVLADFPDFAPFSAKFRGMAVMRDRPTAPMGPVGTLKWTKTSVDSDAV